jgi:hypothetical protein
MKKTRILLIGFWALFIIIILSMGIARHVLEGGNRITGRSREVVLFLMEIPMHMSKLLDPRVLKPLEEPNTFSAQDGFTYFDKNVACQDYLLLPSWDDSLDQSIVKLVRIRDGKILYRWVPEVDTLIKIANTTIIDNVFSGAKNRFTRTDFKCYTPLLLDDGSLIFRASGIFKIDKHSRLVWANTAMCHHTIEPDADGNMWVCAFNPSTRNSDKYQITDDVITQLSPQDGKILYQKSVFEILQENGYDRGEFFINPSETMNESYLDYIHMNDIQPVLRDSRFWKKGDLFLSLRNQNMILLYRPSTNRVLWRQNGPWLRQHDVDIIDSTRIAVFGNNVIEARFANANGTFVDGHSEQYVYDFSNMEVSTPYAKLFASLPIRTRSQGASRILDNGYIYIEETNRARNVLGDYDSAVWSYIERIDSRKLKLLSWNRYITEEEFARLSFLHPSSPSKPSSGD